MEYYHKLVPHVGTTKNDHCEAVVAGQVYLFQSVCVIVPSKQEVHGPWRSA